MEDKLETIEDVWGEGNCGYVGCPNKCKYYSTILINGFIVHYKVCMDHWDLFGKNVAAFHGQVEWREDMKKSLLKD